MAQIRTTRQKQLITDILVSSDVPLTATEIYRRAASFGSGLAKSTVYRNLEAMAVRGEIERGFLETGEAFFSIAGHGHHHYMICRDCNRMHNIPDCPLAHMEEHLKKDMGFVPMEHMVQIYGYCSECARKRGVN